MMGTKVWGQHLLVRFIVAIVAINIVMFALVSCKGVQMRRMPVSSTSMEPISSVSESSSAQQAQQVQQQQQFSVAPYGDLPNGESRRVYVVNTSERHIDSVLAVIRVLTDLRDVDMTIFTSSSNSILSSIATVIMEKVYPYRTLPDLVDSDPAPDLILLTSCLEDTRVLQESLREMLREGSKVMCLVHEAHQWDVRTAGVNRNPMVKRSVKFMIPWMRERKWGLVTMSRRVRRYVKENFPTYLGTGDSISYDSSLLFPVFESPTSLLYINTKCPGAVLVGQPEERRRDVSQPRLDAPSEEIHPVAAISIARCDSYGKTGLVNSDRCNTCGEGGVREADLDLQAYYATIERAVVVVPLITARKYTESEAAGAISASVITGTPALITKKMLEAYDYLPLSGVWIKKSYETDAEAIARIFNYGEQEWIARRRNLLATREDLIDRNMGVFEQILGVDRRIESEV
ncbi:hypothetical protein BZA70DRAFT_199720 [Myxozyma melibiosi]|uniref:Uncharacterized protein n=1 Tax=Myxozyma melibiosi TaxID=54550 RepID=A0ABR1F2N1_9ASCO